jgi:hypothetical protein
VCSTRNPYISLSTTVLWVVSSAVLGIAVHAIIMGSWRVSPVTQLEVSGSWLPRGAEHTARGTTDPVCGDGCRAASPNVARSTVSRLWLLDDSGDSGIFDTTEPLPDSWEGHLGCYGLRTVLYAEPTSNNCGLWSWATHETVMKQASKPFSRADTVTPRQPPALFPRHWHFPRLWWIRKEGPAVPKLKPCKHHRTWPASICIVRALMVKAPCLTQLTSPQDVLV